MELKMEAARERKSVAELVRERVSHGRKKKKKKSVDEMMKEMDKIAKDMKGQNPGLNLSKALIEMRYEQ